MIKFRFSAALLLTIVVLGLASCSSQPKLTPSEKATLQPVAVNDFVQVNPTLSYQGPPVKSHSIVGSVQAASYPGESPDIAFKYAQTAHPHISAIVRQAFINELKRSGRFRLTNYRNANAVFHLSVTKFGLATAHIFSKKLKPLLVLQATLVNKDNRVLWQQSVSIDGTYQYTPAFSIATLDKNDQYLFYAWQVAAEHAAQLIINKY